MIYSLKNGSFLSEIPYEEVIEQGMIITVKIDEETNTLFIFKYSKKLMIKVYDLISGRTTGLLNNISDSFLLPINKLIYLRET